jgi:hypothetical protein
MTAANSCRDSPVLDPSLQLRIKRLLQVMVTTLILKRRSNLFVRRPSWDVM